ncbi:hypothetical protein HOD05_01745 [Candidatus Woesearchaeota archaeon]|jgi:hypothetical protein|nr:hypothetical protein [Candidatus Woesearchaeota archaeon]MBT4151125.1 hypothetical protein [Candidatus Woesearchaeota archaeon]MBT4247943.1 hypothetical protein [Candidatus Woesearchaeota archaeon]MBT4433918.1 hypothetical protein [Candidatus Woesearchaeota archaeon]MBT7332023.1 hypothetical protein [Candidatus Woesearchaeota archaeon]
MNPNRFKNLVEICHREWLSKSVGIPSSHKYGVDLLSDEIGIELKSRLRRRNKKNEVLQGNSRFAVHEYQVPGFPEEHPNVDLYWAFLFYDLGMSVDDVPPYYTPREIEPHISGREAWFFNWEWIDSFPVSYPKTGPYRYVGIKDFPEPSLCETLKVNEGRIYFNPESNLRKKLKI